MLPSDTCKKAQHAFCVGTAVSSGISSQKGCIRQASCGLPVMIPKMCCRLLSTCDGWTDLASSLSMCTSVEFASSGMTFGWYAASAQVGFLHPISLASVCPVGTDCVICNNHASCWPCSACAQLQSRLGHKLFKICTCPHDVCTVWIQPGGWHAGSEPRHRHCAASHFS